MGITTLFLLAIGLSMDAFAVAISNGLCMQKFSMGNTLKIAFAFGLAQGVMPILGYLAGQTFSETITSIDHWVALIFLGIIGFKMIIEAVSEMRSKKTDTECSVISTKMLIFQAIATSIDALAVGISFAVMKVNIWVASSFIACTTFIFSIIGVIIGKKSGKYLKTKAELAGGILLVLIGVKIFIEHLIE